MKAQLKKLKSKLAPPTQPHPQGRFRGVARRKLQKCPICKHEHNEHIYYVWSGDDRVFSTVCKQCGLFYNLTALEPDFLERMGKHGGSLVFGKKNSLSVKNRAFDLTYERGLLYASFIKKNIQKPNPRLLDVTTQYGGTLKAYRQNGFNPIGIDNSKELVEFGISKGVDMVFGSFLEFESDTKFDVVSMPRVINHYVNPSDYLLKAASLLNEGGVIFIEQLDALHAIARKGLERAIQLDHPIMYTLESLRYQLAVTGFKIIDLQSDVSNSGQFKSLNHIHLVAQKSADVEPVKPIADRELMKVNAAIAQYAVTSSRNIHA